MPRSTEYFADTINPDRISGVVDDTLRSLRITGSLLLREAYAAPWSIAVPDTASLAALLGLTGNTHVVAFHLVEFGHCTITPKDGDPLLLKAGEMVICFGGGAHRLSQGRPSITQSIETLLSGGPNIQHPNSKAGPGDTALLCGVFLLRDTLYNPLYTALPRLTHSSLSRPGELHNLSGVARLMAEEIDRKSPGGGFILERLLEVLCAEAMRAQIERIPQQETGWFRGIKDPIIGRAIMAIHEQPGANWSVQRLAKGVAMSPSRFAARFSASVGDSPMAYLTKWRMNLACRELANTRRRIDQISETIGYESPAAFTRAFKKHIGKSPAAWRSMEL